MPLTSQTQALTEISEALINQSIDDMLNDINPETWRDDLGYLAEHGLLH